MYPQLGEIQQKDWKELSIDEKKAGELTERGGYLASCFGFNANSQLLCSLLALIVLRIPFGELC